LGDEGRYQEAMLISDIVARVAAHLNDENMRGYMLFSRADIAGSMEDYDASIAMYEEAVSIFRSTDDIRGESIAINNLGMALNNQERYAEAIETYSRAIELKLLRQQEDPAEDIRASLASSYYGLGLGQYNLGRFDDAIDSYRSADSLYVLDGSLESQRSHLNSLNQIGKGLLKLNQFDEALETFNRSREDASLIGYAEGEADALDEFGYAWYLLDEE